MPFTAPTFCVLLLSIFSSILVAQSSTTQFYPRELDFYDPSQFVVRTGHSGIFSQLSRTMEIVVDLLVAIVVGGYLYIDGGEIYLNDTGGNIVYPGSRPPWLIYHTLVALLTRVQRTPPTLLI